MRSPVKFADRPHHPGWVYHEITRPCGCKQLLHLRDVEVPAQVKRVQGNFGPCRECQTDADRAAFARTWNHAHGEVGDRTKHCESGKRDHFTKVGPGEAAESKRTLGLILCQECRLARREEKDNGM